MHTETEILAETETETEIFRSLLKIDDNFVFWDDFLGEATEHPTLIC